VKVREINASWRRERITERRTQGNERGRINLRVGGGEKDSECSGAVRPGGMDDLKRKKYTIGGQQGGAGTSVNKDTQQRKIVIDDFLRVKMECGTQRIKESRRLAGVLVQKGTQRQ